MNCYHCENPSSLVICKSPDGGYVVYVKTHDSGLTIYRFASTTIDEALEYIRKRIEGKVV